LVIGIGPKLKTFSGARVSVAKLNIKQLHPI
jgi:hypothetical protein